MKYNPEIHQRKSIRLKEYDYSQSGYYFITICTKDREQLFGEINEGKMLLNDYGEIVLNSWNNLPNYNSNIGLDYFCIMPNHIHCILIIERKGGVTPPLPIKLGNIIAYFKYQTTKQINIIQNTPGQPIWQRNYYEHIIRNEKELFEIRKYIEYNPLNWPEDEYNL
jgi:REP element-mobilizing transposase RayT